MHLFFTHLYCRRGTFLLYFFLPFLRTGRKWQPGDKLPSEIAKEEADRKAAELQAEQEEVKEA